MGVALKEIQTIILTYLRRPDKIITILLLDDPHRKELIQFAQTEGVKEQAVSNSLDKAYDQSLDARDKHFHLIEKPFAHLVTDDGENECYRASSCLH